MGKYKHIKENRKGLDRLEQIVSSLKKNPQVKVGFLKNSGKHEDSEGLTVVQVAVFNEFGTATSPKRPFMRYAAISMADEMKRLSAKLVRGIVEDRISIPLALDILGLKATNRIKKVIVDWDSPSNAPSTILAKARKRGRQMIGAASRKDAAMSSYNNPLIDTSQMLNSVNYEKVNT